MFRKIKSWLGKYAVNKNKQLDLAYHTGMVSLDTFLLMKTWQNENSDSICKASSELNLNDLHLDTVHQANEET